MIKLKSLLLEFGDPTDADEYYYHVTLAPYIDRIKKNGLKPNMKSTVTNYKSYSQGKLFFCDVGGLEWWINKIGEHAFHNFDDERFHDVAVFKVLKSKLPTVEYDKTGSDDSKSNAYYTQNSIPPQDVEFVKLISDPY